MVGRSDITANTIAVRFKDCKNGIVEPLVLDSAATPTTAFVALNLTTTINVKVIEPRLSFTSNVTLNAAAITAAGVNTGSEIIRPIINNRGTGVVSNAVRVFAGSDTSGPVSGVMIDDPKLIGPFAACVRMASAGGNARYLPSRVPVVTAGFSVDSGVVDFSIVNIASPALPLRAIGWHGGEKMGDSATGTAIFPSGQAFAYKLGNNWSGNGLGRLTETSNGGSRMFAANFKTADIDIQADVILGSSTRAGFCLRASSSNTYLTVSRASGMIKIHKMVLGGITELATVATSLPATMFARLQAVIVGNVIAVLVNGVQVLSHTLTGGDETTFVSTNHGLYGDTAGAAGWEAVVIRSSN